MLAGGLEEEGVDGSYSPDFGSNADVGLCPGGGGGAAAADVIARK